MREWGGPRGQGLAREDGPDPGAGKKARRALESAEGALLTRGDPGCRLSPGPENRARLGEEGFLRRDLGGGGGPLLSAGVAPRGVRPPPPPWAQPSGQLRRGPWPRPWDSTPGPPPPPVCGALRGGVLARERGAGGGAGGELQAVRGVREGTRGGAVGGRLHAPRLPLRRLIRLALSALENLHVCRILYINLFSGVDFDRRSQSCSRTIRCPAA